MAINLELHEDDQDEMFRIRRELLGWHYGTGTTQKLMAETLGRSEKFIHQLETGHTHYRFSSLQQWASLFDLRVEPVIKVPKHARLPENYSAELTALRVMALPFDAARWVRLRTVCLLAAYRVRLGISPDEMALRLNLRKSAVYSWERESHDPLMPKLFTYARALAPESGKSFIKFPLIQRRHYRFQ